MNSSYYVFSETDILSCDGIVHISRNPSSLWFIVCWQDSVLDRLGCQSASDWGSIYERWRQTHHPQRDGQRWLAQWAHCGLHGKAHCLDWCQVVFALYIQSALIMLHPPTHSLHHPFAQSFFSLPAIITFLKKAADCFAYVKLHWKNQLV